MYEIITDFNETESTENRWDTFWQCCRHTFNFNFFISELKWSWLSVLGFYRYVLGKSLIAGFVAALLCLFGGVFLSICGACFKHMKSSSNVVKYPTSKSPGKDYVWRPTEQRWITEESCAENVLHFRMTIKWGELMHRLCYGCFITLLWHINKTVLNQYIFYNFLFYS